MYYILHLIFAKMYYTLHLIFRFNCYKEPSVRNPSDIEHLVGLLKHEWKTLSQKQEETHQTNHHLWPACASTCFPVFLSLLIMKQAATCVSFFCSWNPLSVSFECWSKYWRRSCSARLGLGFKDM